MTAARSPLSEARTKSRNDLLELSVCDGHTLRRGRVVVSVHSGSL